MLITLEFQVGLDLFVGFGCLGVRCGISFWWLVGLGLGWLVAAVVWGLRSIDFAWARVWVGDSVGVAVLCGWVVW